MAAPLRIAVIGTGAIGRRHAALCADHPDCRLAAIVDPSPAAAALADSLGAPWHGDLDGLLARERPDGCIVATPTQTHEEIGLQLVAAGIPLLMEKPVAADDAGAQRLVEAARRAGLPLLVGHHRRHNPIVAEARRIVRGGELGRLIAVNLLWAVLKPKAYFDIPWRRQPGAGPVLTNLIHDVDLLRFICGEIATVTALTDNRGRGLAVEDTAAALLRFADGAVGTITATDAAPSPWSWDANTGENPGIAMSRGSSVAFLGTQASLEFPDLHLWRPPAGREPGWGEPLTRENRLIGMADAYRRQLTHLCAVLRGEEEPLSSGADAARSLAATRAILDSAASGRTITLNQDGLCASR